MCYKIGFDQSLEASKKSLNKSIHFIVYLEKMQDKNLLQATGESYEFARMYLEQNTDYYKLEISKRLAKTFSDLITLAVISIFALLILIFLSIAAGFFLAPIVGSTALAFLLITALYILIVLAVFINKRKVITNPIAGLIVKNLLD